MESFIYKLDEIIALNDQMIEILQEIVTELKGTK